MERKIVFFDIDGTIYNFFKGMPEDTVLAIKQLKQNGHIPVICTGRTKCMIYPEHLEPGFEYIVGGAGTYVEIDGKEKYYYEIEKEKIDELIKGFIRNGFVPVAEGRDNLYIFDDWTGILEKNKRILDIYYEKIPNVILPIKSGLVCASKVSGVFTEHSNIEQMKNEFERDYTFVLHSNQLFEAIPKPFNKAKGIERMINELGISKENTYAFGDSFNDIDMLQYVQYGCAMGNSDPEIIEMVKYVTKDYDKGGIVHGLKMFDLI